MSDLNHQIHLALRTAAGHARAAHDAMSAADKTYEMKMKSAGAAVYEAWELAVRSLPEYQGRKIDDKALVRIYEGTTPRQWWDKHLSTIKVDGKPADREWAKRTLQWHLDPDAARARRAQAVVRSAAHHRRVKEAAEARPRHSGGSNAPSTAEMKAVAEAKWGKGDSYHPAPRPAFEPGYGTQSASPRDEIDRLLERIRKAVRGLSDAGLSEAEGVLRDTAEAVENME
jgi:hypothetical protein